MTKALKYIFFIAILAAFLYGLWFFRSFFLSPTNHIEKSRDVIMERMEKVNKLITLEAYYSEVYDHKDYYYYDISPFRKKALIRVKAKVSVGYNFASINMTADETKRIVTIYGFPKPEILSIDHDLDYYDLTEGTFNSFTEADYNAMNKGAKDYIREKAMDKSIFKEAADKKGELIEMFEWMLNASGWKLEIFESEQAENKGIDLQVPKN